MADITFDGIINIYKEKGFTSHDVCAVIRKYLRPIVNGKLKVGHTGTLDPMAEGVLPVCLGKATKQVNILQDTDKTYRAVMRLGLTTDTEDITGAVLRENDVSIDEDTLNKAVQSFLGVSMQTPPMYSAIKIDGQRLYKAARAGREIERPARQIIIHEIKLTRVWENEAEIEVTCGKGTYIRTLIKDIGEKLGCGACMAELTRLRSGDFTADTAIRLGELKELAEAGKITEAIIPI